MPRTYREGDAIYDGSKSPDYQWQGCVPSQGCYPAGFKKPKKKKRNEATLGDFGLFLESGSGEFVALLRAVVANQEDPLPALVFADWLEESGDAILDPAGVLLRELVDRDGLEPDSDDRYRQLVEQARRAFATADWGFGELRNFDPAVGSVTWLKSVPRRAGKPGLSVQSTSMYAGMSHGRVRVIAYQGGDVRGEAVMDVTVDEYVREHGLYPMAYLLVLNLLHDEFELHRRAGSVAGNANNPRMNRGGRLRFIEILRHLGPPRDGRPDTALENFAWAAHTIRQLADEMVAAKATGPQVAAVLGSFVVPMFVLHDWLMEQGDHDRDFAAQYGRLVTDNLADLFERYGVNITPILRYEGQ